MRPLITQKHTLKCVTMRATNNNQKQDRRNDEKVVRRKHFRENKINVQSSIASKLHLFAHCHSCVIAKSNRKIILFTSLRIVECHWLHCRRHGQPFIIQWQSASKGKLFCCWSKNAVSSLTRKHIFTSVVRCYNTECQTLNKLYIGMSTFIEICAQK